MFLKTNINYCSDLKKKQNLINEIKNYLNEYLTLRLFPKEIIDKIIDENFINSNPSYYLYYPYLFNDYFQIKDKKTLNLLSISGFLYYKAIILIDDIFDTKKNHNDFQQFLLANICQEETIKILSSLFPLKSDFWKTWNLRKIEYAKAYKLDKNLKNIECFSEFETLADYKSTFGKIAIDCLYFLSNKKEKSLYKALLESHKYFYVGFQIMDDISDYAEDFENGQFNIANHELTKLLNSNNDRTDNYSLEEQKKLIYLKGVSEYLYKRTAEYIDKSLKNISQFQYNTNSFWVNEINSLYNTSVTHLLNIEGFISVYNAEKKVHSSKKNGSDLNEAITSSINYMVNLQLSDGCWNDVFNDAGVSDVWTTSYVVYSLKESFSCSFLDRAKAYLIKNQSSNSLWGYNNVWIEDADSSSFAILSLKKDYDNFGIIFNKWLKYQNEDGGFTTYNSKDVLFSSLNSSYIQNVDGWMQSHFCVSAVAFLVFEELDITAKDEFNKLRAYLIDKLNTNNKILSYWWKEDIYALYFILISAVRTNDTEMTYLIEKRIEKLIKEKKSFNFFFKGFLLKTLCLTDHLYHKYLNEIKELVSEMLLNQFTDGSWQEHFSLKIPYPSIMNPNNDNISWQLGNQGTNILVKDYNRVFTTTSCLTALKAYESRL